MSQATAEFGTVNIVVMVAFVIATLGIGVFYGILDRRSEKLIISRNMSIAPVSFSIMATFMSAILIVGTPSEIYFFGLEWMVVVLAFPLAGALGSFMFLPIFHRLRLTSVYEYLGLRYGERWISALTTVAFMVQNLLYTSIALVAPSIVLSSVTGIGDGAAIAAIGLLGTAYTAFGGFRAVVWADVLQAFIMFAGIIAVNVQGCVNVGGLAEMLDISREHGRLNMFSWHVDPLERLNFWNTFFGQTVMWLSLLGVNQPSVQRLLSLPTYKKSAITLAIGVTLIMLIGTLACTAGLAIFATYASCDPLASGQISRRDQIVPHFVAEQFHHVPGLGGLFIACVLSGALSTISSSLNSLAAVTWEDFLKRCSRLAQLGAHSRAWIIRGSAFGFGLVAIALALLAKTMGSVIQVAIGVYGGAAGPILGVFCLAVLVPFSNPTGAAAGLVSGLIVALWVSFGSSFGGLPPPATLPTQIVDCNFNSTDVSNTTLLSASVDTTPALTNLGSDISERSALQTFYSISYMLFSIIGLIITLIVGVIASCLTGGSQVEVDPDHLSPPVSWMVKRKTKKENGELSNGHGTENSAFEMDPENIENNK